MSWIELTLRIVVSFLVLLIMARLMGKRQLSHLTFFNYITGITIGSMAASLTIDSRLPILQGVYSLILWSALTIALSYITLKSPMTRLVTDGQPTILIKKGAVDKKTMIQMRVSMDDLTMLLRENKVFDIKEVDYAILEPNGQLTVMKKPEYEQVTRKDMYIPVQSIKNLPAEIIVDGKYVEKNIREFDVDRIWLDNEISNQGYLKVGDIFYAELTREGDLFVMPRHEGKDRPFH